MRNLAFALLLLCSSASAVTYNKDGSVTMSKEEFENITAALNQSAEDSYRADHDKEEAFRDLRKKDKELESMKVGVCI